MHVFDVELQYQSNQTAGGALTFFVKTLAQQLFRKKIKKFATLPQFFKAINCQRQWHERRLW